MELLNNFRNETISLSKVFLEGDDEVKQDLLKSALWNFTVQDKRVASVWYKTLYEKLEKASKSSDFAL